jgi:hypothetical protein
MSKPKLQAVETEVDPATAAAKIAPVTVGNPVTAASLAIDQEHLEELANPDAKSSVVECRRPPKGIFFTARPEPEKPWKDRRFYYMLELEGRDPFIVAQSIADKKKGGRRHDPSCAARPLRDDGRRGSPVAAQVEPA